jgi:hypothetical protein
MTKPTHYTDLSDGPPITFGTPDEPTLEHHPAEILVVHPDDTLIFRFQQRLTQAQADFVRQQIADRIDPKIHFLVTSEDVQITVLRPATPEEALP